MGLFNRKKGKNESNDDSSSSENKKEKGGWRRPANTAFKQQRLKAWQPILTPKTVLPTLFIIGILFAPIGGLLIWGSSLVTEMTFDYTDCDSLTSSSSNGSLSFTDIPTDKYNYRLRSADSGVTITRPQYAYLDSTGNESVTNPFETRQCVVRFHVPADLEPSVFMYYKLTNFYQNHRRYVKSLNSDQLQGKFVSNSDLDDSDCKPLGTLNGKAIYPCGLIANSVFNDTFTNATFSSSQDFSPESTYEFSFNNIAWPGERKKYTDNPVRSGGWNSYSDIVPPPNWGFYNGSYSEENPPPNLQDDQHFQNWMRTAGLPTFTKLYGRNDEQRMRAGWYQIIIGMNYPVKPYKGTKSIVISTVSWIGGKNPFLGWAYVATAALFVVLAIAGTVRHLIRPRRLGDMSLLSWNR